MAIYKKDIRNDQMNFNLTEQHIYGSSRLGVDRRNVDMIAASTPSDNVTLSMKRGEKHYELSNHLGNVLATVSDKKIAVMNGANLSYHRADVVSYSDYYPFGAPMTERTALVTPTDVRYGFNGKEVDSEGMGGGLSTYDYGFRIYNPHIAKFLSTDPLSKDYPWYTPYQFAGNKPIIAIDLDGLEEFIRTDYFNAAGNLYRTEIQVLERPFINGQIVHQSTVNVNNAGNAVVNYIGTTYGNSLPGGTGSNLFNPNENALIWNRNVAQVNTAQTFNGVQLIGTLFNITRPAYETGDIITTQAFVPNGPAGPILNATGGIELGPLAPVNSVRDPDYRGMVVITNPAAVPANEPYLPAGFNNVPLNPANRINTATRNTFAQDNIAGVTNNSGGSFLRNESFTPQGNVLAGSNDNTSSDAGFGQTIIVNSPQRGAVGSGNAQTTPSSSTVTIVN